MRIYDNGIYRDATEAEIVAEETMYARYLVAERTRPLNIEEVTALLIKQQINSISVDDNTALRMVEFYPEWAAGVDYSTDYKVQRGGKLWLCANGYRDTVSGARLGQGIWGDVFH